MLWEVCSRMYDMGKGLGKILTALRYFFNLFSAATWEVYKAPLKLVRRVLSCPFLVSIRCQKVFFCHFHFKSTQSSEWLRLSLVLKLNLFQRPRIWWHSWLFITKISVFIHQLPSVSRWGMLPGSAAPPGVEARLLLKQAELSLRTRERGQVLDSGSQVAWEGVVGFW